jgi:hypothetical protein
MFKQPFYVSPHAVQRFRERVADLSTFTIRTIIQAALQDIYQPVIIHRFNKQECPVYRARYRNIEYFIPVLRENIKKDAWPAVPTILTSDMEIENKLYEKGGWKW